jgi:hypothetical protein
MLRRYVDPNKALTASQAASAALSAFKRGDMQVLEGACRALTWHEHAWTCADQFCAAARLNMLLLIMVWACYEMNLC